MTTTTHVHNVTEMKAQYSAGFNWLKIKLRDGSDVTIFMEAHEAEALAEAWAEAQIEPDLPDAESIAQRDETYRRQMEAAGRWHLLK